MSDVVCALHQLIEDSKSYLKHFPKEKKCFLSKSEEKFFPKEKVKNPSQKNAKPSFSPPPQIKPTIVKPLQDKKSLPTEVVSKDKALANIVQKEEENFHDLLQLVKKIAPDYGLHTTLPDDKMAQHLSKIWKYQNLSFPLGVVFFHEEIEEKQFLRNIAKAIDLYLIPCRLIDGSFLDKENGWDTFFTSKDLKFVLVPERVQTTLSFFQKNRLIWDAAKNSYFFGNVEVLPLKEFSFYALHAKEKALLWKNLKKKFLLSKDL